MGRGWLQKSPFLPLFAGECGPVAWVEQSSSPFPVQGAGNQCWGWWVGNSITACQIFKLFFFIYIYIYINATVLLWSIKDPLLILKWWSSLRGLKLVDMRSSDLPARLLRLKGSAFHPWLRHCQHHVFTQTNPPDRSRGQEGGKIGMPQE